MPQLDVNTFIYQYISVITTLAIFYVLLSYLILPIVLRGLVIRSYFTQGGAVFSELLAGTAHTNILPFLRIKASNPTKSINTLWLCNSVTTLIANKHSSLFNIEEKLPALTSINFINYLSLYTSFVELIELNEN